MKKDMSQYNACTTWRQISVLANLWIFIKTSVHSFCKIPKDYSINNLVVDYADSEKIKKNQPFNSEISIQCLFTDLVRVNLIPLILN